MPVKKQEAHRALELLEEYHAKLTKPEEQPLREAIAHVIMIFKSRLFQALLDIQEFYEQTLLNETKSLAQKTHETNRMAEHWEKNPPIQFYSNGRVAATQRPEHKQVTIQSDVTILTKIPMATGVALTPKAPPVITPTSDHKAAPTGRAGRHKPSMAHHADGMRESDSQAASSTKGEWEYEDILLEKSATGLGFSVAGGSDSPRYPNDSAIYLSKLIPGGAAEKDGRLKKGDVIMRVNDTDFTNTSHSGAVDALKKAGSSVRLYVRRRKKSAQPGVSGAAAGPYQQIELIELSKGTRGLGFSIAGGIGNEHIPGDTGIYITKIIEGGAAHLSGRLRVDDKILAVGNTSFENVAHDTAVAALKAVTDRVVLTVAKASPLPAVLPTSDQSYSMNDTLPIADGKHHARHPERTSTGISAPHVMANESPTEITRSPRRVTLTKGPAGLGFNIIGGEDNEGIYISYIVPSGVTDLSGAVFKGDQLLEVNNADLCQATHEQAASALKHSGQIVALVLQYRPEAYARFEEKLRQLREEYSHHHQGQSRPIAMPYVQVQPVPKRELFVRALFDYDPVKDSGLPSRGLPFNYGDFLHVVNASDDEWWQARRVIGDGVEEGNGIIPSKKRVEKRERARRKQVNFSGPVPLEKQSGFKKSLSLSRKFPFMKSREHLNEESDTESKPEEPIHSYEPVERRHIKYARPVVMLGPLKDRINDDLLAEFPDRYTSCVPHTSRPRRDNEMDGREYHFVSRQQMEQDITNHRFIEAGQFKDNLYGTSVDAVRTVAEKGKHCTLDVSVNAVKRLRAASLFPIVVLVKPYSASQLCEWDRRLTDEEAEREYQRCLQTEQSFADCFTATVQGNTPEEVYSRVKDIIRENSSPVAWVPSDERL